jgi:predicted dithiol-disulfide oxidoreductase (DUF899 family)
MATWTVKANGATSGQVTLASTDRMWFNSGTALTDNVTVGSYQDGTHVSDNADSHLAGCTSAGHISNVKYLTSTTMSLDGAASANLSTLTAPDATMEWTFDDASSVATTGAKFYAYATADGTPVSGVTVQAAEAAVTSTWVSIGTTGLAANGLALADDTAATSHDYNIAISVSPTSTGAKTTNVFKLSLTYV